MTYPRFIVKNAFRNKRRTSLTVLSMGFSLFLVILLQTFLHTLLNPPQTEKGALRLVVRGATALGGALPMAYREKLKIIPHVKAVLPLQWVGAHYLEPKNFFPNFATDPEALWEVFPDFVVSEETKKAFREERTGAVVQEELLSAYHLKVGDRITLLGTTFPVDIEVKIVGTFSYPEKNNILYFRLDYFDEAMGNPGTVGTYFLLADSAESVPGIIDYADEMFRNSPAMTKTETEKAFRLGFVSMLGNVQMLIGSIVVVVVFTMLLVTASTMAMTIRERLREVAILKSLGYPRRVILLLILGEAAFMAILGGLVGCAFAFIMANTDLSAITRGFIRAFHVRPEAYGSALGVGVLIGVASGLLPAVQAARMTITQGLRRLD